MNRTEAYEIILEGAELHKHALKGNARRSFDCALRKFRTLVTRLRARTDRLHQRRHNPHGLCGLR